MRKPSGIRSGKPDSRQHLDYLRLAPLAVVYSVDNQRFFNAVPDATLGVERGERVLKDHLHVAPQLS
ncbi:hypothetical protein PEC301296_05920 [Pectobacterium carotovorum subsp. carotovorum]|nr:hypothetical protein KP24_21950 [Pectobacterium atrosepticum]GKV84280.1 hypothetical protein PEC301296_05920 [Pectobacterium carotovorum subsp. carotovorum]